MRNPARAGGSRTAEPGAGLGSGRAAERAELAAGGLDHRGTDGGAFELPGWLPWTT